MNNYKIQTRQVAGKWIATVLQWTGFDQREGDSHKTLAVAMAATEAEAILAAVNEAF